MSGWLPGLLVAVLAVIGMPVPAGEYGELKLSFGLDSRRETIQPGTLVGVEQKTPRKRAPMMVASWRLELGTPRTPGFESTFIQFSASREDATDLGISLLLERQGKFTHYGSRCQVSARPPCDPTRHGLTHDAVNKRVLLKNVELRRVTHEDADPRDTVTVSGELRYSE